MLSFSVAIRPGVASPLERCCSLLTRLMIPNRFVIAINVKRANIPVYRRLPLPLLDACMPQPVNTFCLIPTSPPVWHGITKISEWWSGRCCFNTFAFKNNPLLNHAFWKVPLQQNCKLLSHIFNNICICSDVSLQMSGHLHILSDQLSVTASDPRKKANWSF